MTNPPQNTGPGQPWGNDPQQPNGLPQQPTDAPLGQSAGQHLPQGASTDPYAQAGAPYGQPGHPQGASTDPYAQAGAPYGQPGAGGHGAQAFPETPKKGGGLKNILYALLALALLLGGGWAIINGMQKEAALEVGKCLVFSGESDDADHKEVKCDDPSTFSYLVAKVIDGSGSCGADYSEYTLSTERRGSSTTNKTVCLIPQFAPNTCYTEAGAGDVNDFVVAPDCKEADFKVTKVVDAATAECEADAEPWSWTEPARTYCLAAAA